VCKLDKAIYGLKQAPRVWYEKLKTTFVNLNYHPTKSDNSLYIKNHNNITVFILVYVDDIIIIGNCIKEIRYVTDYLNNKFSLKDLGNLKYFLGIEVIRKSEHELILCQRKYISEVPDRAKMSAAKPMPTPMSSNLHLSKNKVETFENKKLYRSIAGALQYITITRPD